MDKNKTLKIALPVLLVIVMIVWGPVLFGSGSKGKSNSVNKGNIGSSDLTALPRSGNQKRAKTQYAEWGQNPFMLKRAPKALYIEGIMWDANDPKAIINSSILGVGDKVESKTIIEITPNSVILKDEKGKEVELTY